jgi:hypothetical protein
VDKSKIAHWAVSADQIGGLELSMQVSVFDQTANDQQAADDDHSFITVAPGALLHAPRSPTLPLYPGCASVCCPLTITGDDSHLPALCRHREGLEFAKQSGAISFLPSQGCLRLASQAWQCAW